MKATMINKRVPTNRAAHVHSTCFILSQQDRGDLFRRLALHRSTACYRTPTRLPRSGPVLVAWAAGILLQGAGPPNRPGASRQPGFSLWNDREPVLHVGDPRRGPSGPLRLLTLGPGMHVAAQNHVPVVRCDIDAPGIN